MDFGCGPDFGHGWNISVFGVQNIVKLVKTLVNYG
jgi:hypothetical protein